MSFPRMLRLSLLLVLIFFPLPLAQAHAELVFSNPAVGAHLATLPTQIEVTFDGNLLSIGSAKTNVLVVKDPQGRQIDAKNSHVLGAKLSVDVNPVTTTGEFTVSWRVVSGDGHPEEGSYRFTVGQVVASAVATPTTSMSSATSTTAQNVPHKDFWTRYSTRLLLLLAAAVGVVIWIVSERMRRSRPSITA